MKSKLKDLLLTTKDGDWGDSTPKDGFCPFYIIRGADFPAVRSGDYSSVPIGYLNKNTVQRRILIPGDIIIETAGGNRGRPTGRTLHVKPSILAHFDLPVTCASFCRFLRINPEKVDTGYVFWYLQFMYNRGDMWEYQVQHTGVARFQYTVFANSIDIPLPPLPTQRAIAHILGTLDDKIELNRKMNETLEAMAQAIFKSWFVDFDPVRAKMEGVEPAGMDAETAALFPGEFEIVDGQEVPKGWNVGFLPDFIEVTPKRSLSKDQIAPYLDMQNVPTQGHRPIDWIERAFGSGTKFVNGDTLLARITPCLEHGKTIFVDFLNLGQVGWGSTEYIVLRPREPLPKEFGYFLARDNEFREYAILNMSGSSGRQRVPTDCLNSYQMISPSEAVANKFGEIANQIIGLIKQNDEETRTLRDIRDTLLPKLMSGELDQTADEGR